MNFSQHPAHPQSSASPSLTCGESQFLREWDTLSVFPDYVAVQLLTCSLKTHKEELMGEYRFQEARAQSISIAYMWPLQVH